jgi:hypothetical protein
MAHRRICNVVGLIPFGDAVVCRRVGLGSSRNAARFRRGTSRKQCLPAPATYQNGRDPSTPQSAVSNYFEWHGSGGMPKLSIDPSDPGDEAVGFDGAKNRPCLRIDLMDLPVSILPDPKRTFGPREPRIAAATGGPAEERCTIRSAPFRATFSESGAANRFAEVITSVQFVRVSC